jgi:hypothetical protein
MTSDSTRIPITTAEFLSTLSQASRLNLPAKVDTTRPLNDQYFLQILAKIFDQELVVLINWAKAMPGISFNSFCFLFFLLRNIFSSYRLYRKFNT